jgi:hypothetical protein
MSKLLMAFTPPSYLGNQFTLIKKTFNHKRWQQWL